MSKNNQKSNELLAKCPIDGELFTSRPGKLVCSPKCKRKMDSENRRRVKTARRFAEYKRLKVLLGFQEDEEFNLKMLRKQLRNQDEALTNQARGIFVLFFTTVLFLVLWLAK